MKTPVTHTHRFDFYSFLVDSGSFPKQPYTLHARVPIYRANQGLSAIIQVWIRH
jgi:hypothetical protein